MSADFDFTMTTPALIKAAELYHACPTFHTERDGTRHRCTACEQSEAAHIIVALRTALTRPDTLDSVQSHLVDAHNTLGHIATGTSRQENDVEWMQHQIDVILERIDALTDEREDR